MLSQGIAAVKAGNVQQARLLLDGAIRQNPNDERTWGWFYNVCENDEERIRCLRELLRINPNREIVKKKLGELTGFESPLLSPKLQPVTPNRLSQPIQKVEKRGNHTWIWIGVLAILAIIVCIGGIIVFGGILISNPANIQPTVTNVPIVINAPAMFGKSVDEIRELYQVDESLPLQMIEPGTFSHIPQGSYWEAYFFRKYNIDFFYDASMHVIGFDVFSGLIDDQILITDWNIALKMFNFNVTSLPDFCAHDFSGNHSCSSIDDSYLGLIWWNNNGHMIDIRADYSTDCIQTIYVWPPNFSHVP